MFSDAVTVGIIAAASAIAGSVVTGLFNYRGSVQTKKLVQLKKSLKIACEDIIAFYRIEESYSESLSTTERSSDAIKKEIRKKLRDNGIRTPSEEATPLKCQRKIEELD